MTTSPGRLFRTVRHLHPGQIGWRFVHVARMQLNRVRPPSSTWAHEEARFVCSSSSVVVDVPARLRSVAERWRAGEVEHLARAASRADWAGSELPKLWRYERQYHSELVALSLLAAAEPDAGWGEDAKGLVDGWWEACPSPRGDAWEPYPVARRILNWSLAARIAPALGQKLAPGIAAQVRFLAGHLERHLLGNHLLCDAAALVVGSAAVEASGMDRCAALGEALLGRELQRQVLGDGGYAERTAQYHAIVLKDVLLALAFAAARGRSLDPRVTDRARAMASWLEGAARKDTVPFLNDAAPDATPSVTEVLSLARALGLAEGRWDTWLGRAFGGDAVPSEAPKTERGDTELPDTGWSIARTGRHELLFEHGPIGPDEQPGHGHSDGLSFELSWDGHPVVTDTGVTTYDIGPVRDFERSARAHATVTVGDTGPDELWAAFRVGARSVVRGGRAALTPHGIRIYDGTLRAPAGWEHRRCLVFWPGEALIVFDRVSGARAAIRSHVPLDPACTYDDGNLHFGDEALAFEVIRGQLAAIDSDGWVGRGFGKRESRQTLTLAADASGRVAYAFLAPGRSVVVEKGSCAIRGPLGAALLDLSDHA